MSEYSSYLKKVIDSVVRSGWYFEGFESITEEELSNNPRLLVSAQSKLSSILEYNDLLAKAGEGTPIGGILEDDSFKSYWNSQLYFEYLKQNEVESRIPLFDSLGISEESTGEGDEVIQDLEESEEPTNEVQEEFTGPNLAVVRGFLGSNEGTGDGTKETPEVKWNPFGSICELESSHYPKSAEWKLFGDISELETLYSPKNIRYKLLGGISSLEGTESNPTKSSETTSEVVETLSKSSKTISYKLFGSIEFLEGLGFNEESRKVVEQPKTVKEFKLLGGISSLEGLGFNPSAQTKVRKIVEYKLLGSIEYLEGLGENLKIVKEVRVRKGEYKLFGDISSLEGTGSNRESKVSQVNTFEPSRPASSSGFEFPESKSNSYEDVFTPREEKPRVPKKPQKFDTEKQVDSILKGLGGIENKIVKGLKNGSLFGRNRKGS